MKVHYFNCLINRGSSHIIP